MNIIVTTTIYPPDVGGPATYAQEIKNRLTNKGHTLKIVTISPSLKPEPDVYKVTNRTSMKIVGFLLHYLNLFFFLMRISRKSDVIYTLNPGYVGLTSVLSGFFLRKPVMLRFGGDRVWESAFNQGLTQDGLKNFYKNSQLSLSLKLMFHIQKMVLSHSKRVIVPSRDVKEALVENYKLDESKIKVIHTSIELSTENTKPTEHDTFNILVVGRLIKLKRLDVVIKSVQHISQSNPNVKLVIAGDGPCKRHLETLSHEIEAGELVEFLGNVPRDEIKQVYLDSDVLILNSNYEVFPHVVIEAMKYRVPVITSSKGGAREVVFDGKTGLIADPGTAEELEEKIKILLDNENLKNELSENAYKLVKNKFNWDMNINALEKELEELISTF